MYYGAKRPIGVCEDIKVSIELYHGSVPAFLQEFMETPQLKRLQNIGMNCGCEYTSFPRFRRLSPYTRFDHSVGVAMIVWHFTQDPAQAVAGLLHDIATPVFAHVVDFMRGDYMKQESTESGTAKMISTSNELQKILGRYGLTNEAVCDYHIYPVADNETPRLSADRLEYTIGNSINYGISTPEELHSIYSELTVGKNEDGQDELVFSSLQTAEKFADIALQCSKIYVADEDRYAMQMLSELLYSAIQQKVICEIDLYSTEPEVIAKLTNKAETMTLWESFCAYNVVVCSKQPGSGAGWRRIFAKKRCIDPMISGLGRVSDLSKHFCDELKAYQNETLDYWICGRP